jgi:predicted 2-oxoglutarate/Fe(II)-dependent dioxygenase YbiX
MSSIGAKLLDSLRSVERPGDFCVGGIREVFMPAIDVDGVGRIAFPILPAQAERLVAIAEAAPYGRGEATVVDREVRRTWQVDSARVRIGGRHWEKTLGELVADVALGLGVSGPLAADFYKLLVYDAGSFFVDHRDTEKIPGMFATMVLVLPSTYGGGELVVKHAGREVALDLHPEDPSEIGFAGLYADCVHEVRPVTTGFRVALVYNLRFVDRSRPLKAPDYRDEQARVAEALRSWASAEDAPDKLILPLEHAYTPAELSFGALKGADAGLASVLIKAAAEADCDLHLALVSIEESGSAVHTGYYDRRGWSRDEEDEDEEFEVAEVFDRALILSEWRRPDGGEAGFDGFPFAEHELCPPDAFEDLAPDEEHFHEATGNEGASFERTYRRAGLVLWPAGRRLAVLNQAGLRTTLPYLENLTARWETSGASIQSSLWREADELSGHMLRSWPRLSWGTNDDTEIGRMLDLQVRLGNVKRIDEFLAELSAEGHYAASDNGAIVRAAALLPPARATELLVRIVGRNATAHLSACGDLLLRSVATPIGALGDQGRIGAALIDAMPGDTNKREEVDDWTRPTPVRPGFVVDLLSATSRIDAGLAARAIDRLLAWPKTYGPDDVMTPAALALAKLAESKSWPAAARLREASLDHLRRRIALPLEAPRDWTRANPLKCKCADCRALGTFLVAPDQQQWRLKAVQGRRTHVEQSVRSAACDLDLTAERRGSPHTLVATKNQASYRRRAEQRRQDLEHVSALGG